MDSAPTERPAHIDRPHLRRIIPQPVSAENQQGVALRDPLMLCDETIVVPAPTMQALQHFNGEWTLDEIATNLKVPAETVEALVAKLDEVGLLWGPTCESLESDKRDSLHATGVLPMRQSQSLGKDETACGAAIDSLLDKSEDPEVEFDIVGMFAPRIDYPLAGPIYGALYHAVHNGGYDRVLALGNNHYGFSDGVVGTPLGFQSPLGRCECDTTFLDGLVGHLGDAFISDELDHIADHGMMRRRWGRSMCAGRSVGAESMLRNSIWGQGSGKGNGSTYRTFLPMTQYTCRSVVESAYIHDSTPESISVNSELPLR